MSLQPRSITLTSLRRKDRITSMITVPAITLPETDERILRIQGGNRLTGNVRISGAKNAALKALAASLLTKEEVVLNNVPMIADVLSMAQLLREFGAQVEIDKANERVWVHAREITRTDAPPSLFKATRASVVVTGPMLARAGEISFALPGGDQIGRRPIDMHLRGFQRMGTEIIRGEEIVHARVAKLKGARIYMDYPSHTGTEALMMAATKAAGTTLIMNASYEPEIMWLGNLLNRMGARISGLGTPFLTIEGVERLRGVSDIVIPDRLEAATYAVAAVMTGGEITLEDVIDSHLVRGNMAVRQSHAHQGGTRAAQRRYPNSAISRLPNRQPEHLHAIADAVDRHRPCARTRVRGSAALHR